MSQKIIFFAYEDGHLDNKDAIRKGSEQYNQHQKTYKIRRWEDLRVSGNIIGEKIFEQIRNCDIFACDLTYLNHNVLFELGYAIARNKTLKIFLNPNVLDAKNNYSNLSILKNIGYASFSNSKDILKEFQIKYSGNSNILLQNIIPDYKNILIKNKIFLINTKNKNQAALDIEVYLNSLSEKYISNYEDEIAYQTLVWYLNSILESKIILLHMVGTDKIDYQITNAEYSLYAGLALGLDKKLLIIAPDPFHAPIDYTDILINYNSSDDCIKKIETWLKSKLEEILQSNMKSNEITEKIAENKELNLLKLGIGYGVAEKDEVNNSDVFVAIDAYNEALNRNKIIIIGRKGSGKTEIFLRLQENLVSDKNNYNIVIKPDSDEMLSNVELSNLYTNERSKKAFLNTVWQYVILSKIFLQIVKNLNEIDIAEKDEIEAIKFYTDYKDMLELNFYGMILYISNKFYSQNITKDILLLDKIKKLILPMQDTIQIYFNKKKYQKITILADNLDSGWDAKSNLDLQSQMILCLVEYIDHINNKFTVDFDTKIHSVIFLRQDIYRFILRNSREPDKMAIDTFEINWNKFPFLLKDVINKRIQKVLETNRNADNIWAEYFKIKNTTNPLDTIFSYIVKRPRDAIYFISKLFESAVNNNKTIIDDADMNYAIEAYNKFLYNNLIAELKAEFPAIENILKELQKNYSSLSNQFTLIPIDSFYKLVQLHLNKTDADKLLKTMMENNYIVGVIKRSNNIIYNYDALIAKINEKRFKVFKKNKIFLNIKLTQFSE
jgi:hypothetical protein